MTGPSSHADWRDLSDYLVHFTRDPGTPHRGLLETLTGTVRKATAYDAMMGILSSGVLRPGKEPFGCARRIDEIKETQRSVCFSEIPLDLLGRLVERRSLHGIGFAKDFVREQGATPVWYVEKGSPVQAAIESLIAKATSSSVRLDDPVWKLTPFIDHPGDYYGSPYRFEWEREWRHPGELSFAPEDVAFLFIPEDLHDAARRFFEDVAYDNRGPVYRCPFLDPRWPMESVRRALRRESADEADSAGSRS
jgi:hypothetical protein